MKVVRFGLIFLMFLVVTEFGNAPFPNDFNRSGEVRYNNEEQKIFELINKERQKKRLASLKWNSKLADMARSYSQKMAREGFFDHFDNEGNSVSDRAKLMRITRWKLIGENLFMCDGYEKFSEMAVKGWMKSPSHRDNILEVNFNETGIGTARARDGKVYVTQVFMQY